MTTASKLDQAIQAVCPIIGVSIGRKNDKTTWRIDFLPEATAQQKAAAQLVIDSFDVASNSIPFDTSNIDNMEKSFKALALVVAAWNGKTPAQLKAAFKTAYDSLS